MVRLTAVAVVAAAFVASSVEASTCTGCDSTVCDKTYLDTVETPGEKLYNCATTVVNSTIPSYAVVDPSSHTVAKNAVVTLITLLNEKSNAKKDITEVQPFAAGTLYKFATSFLTGFAKKNSIPVTCTTTYKDPITTPSISSADPGASLPILCDLTPLGGLGAAGIAAQTQMSQVLTAVFPIMVDYFMYAFASGLYLELATCFAPECNPLVTFLCKNPTTDYLVPTGTGKVPTTLSQSTLVQASASLGTIALNAISDINFALSDLNPSDAMTVALQKAFLAQVPYDGIPADVQKNVTTNLTGLPCDTVHAIIANNGKGSGAPLQGASVMAAAAFVSSAMFSL
jgi:hypothetical protein